MLPDDPRFDDEIRHHVEERTDRLIADGLPPEEARRRAVEQFGDLDRVRAEVARIHRPARRPLGRFLDAVRKDAGFAVRQLRRDPMYAAAAIVTLGLGVGASAGIYGLVKAVVLDPLPYPEADRLVHVQQVAPDGTPFTVSDGDYRDFAARVQGLEHLTATSRSDFATRSDGRPLRVVAGMVTGDLFPLLGAEAAIGRTFTPEESGTGARPLAVLSHGFWAARFGADPAAVGRTLDLDGTPYEVVGVMPEGWRALDDVDLWAPLPLGRPDRGDHDFTVFGRLAPGATLAAASEELRAVAAALGDEHPRSNEGWSARLTPLKEAVLGPERQQAGTVLLGAVGLLLLMACATVSNLLLARAGARGREMALRASLGASRRRLVQQLLTESMVLAGAGAGVGVALAYGLLPLLRRAAPVDTPRLHEVAVDLQVLAAAVGVALLTGVVFGAAPALHLLRRNLADVRGDSRVTSGDADRLRGALVAGQVAVSLTLLFGAAALGTGFLRLQGTDPGLPVDEAVTVPLMLSGDRYTVDERVVARRAIRDALLAVPGVAAAGVSNVVPFSGMSTAVTVNVEGRPTTPEGAPVMRWRPCRTAGWRPPGSGRCTGAASRRATSTWTPIRWCSSPGRWRCASSAITRAPWTGASPWDGTARTTAVWSASSRTSRTWP